MANELNLRSDGSIDQTINDWGKEFAAATVSGNAITFSSSAISLTGESGAADDLDTIANGGTMKMLLITPADIDNPVTIRNGIGNIVTGDADLVLDQPNQLVLLVYNGSVWVALAQGFGAALGDGCHELDFTASNGSFETYLYAGENAGSYVGSTGWRTVLNTPETNHLMAINLEFGEMIYVTRLEATVDNPSGFTSTVALVMMNGDTEVTSQTQVVSAAGVTVVDKSFSPPTQRNAIGVRITNDSDTNFNWTLLTNLKVYIKGEMPFSWTDDC